MDASKHNRNALNHIARTINFNIILARATLSATNITLSCMQTLSSWVGYSHMAFESDTDDDAASPIAQAAIDAALVAMDDDALVVERPQCAYDSDTGDSVNDAEDIRFCDQSLSADLQLSNFAETVADNLAPCNITRFSSPIFALDALAVMPASDAEFLEKLLTDAADTALLDEFSSTEHGQMLRHIVSQRLCTRAPGRVKTWKDASESACAEIGIDTRLDQRYRQCYIEAAELLKTSSELLGASMAVKQLQVFRAGREKGIVLLFTLQGDEAQTMMRVQDESSVATTALVASQLEGTDTTSRGKRKAARLAVNVKVQYWELKVTMITQCATNQRFRARSFHLPCHLDHFDRCTGENIHASQKRLLDVLGFSGEILDHFKHVGVAACMDQAGGCKRQVSAGNVDDLKLDYGGKRRFRIATPCDVHNFARCITASFFCMQGLIGQMIAFAITERLPNKFEELKEIVGERLWAICEVCRRLIWWWWWVWGEGARCTRYETFHLGVCLNVHYGGQATHKFYQ